MKEIKYGAMVNGGYVTGAIKGRLQTSDNFDELLYTDSEGSVLGFIERARETFPDAKFEIVKMIIEREEIK